MILSLRLIVGIQDSLVQNVFRNISVAASLLDIRIEVYHDVRTVIRCASNPYFVLPIRSVSIFSVLYRIAINKRGQRIKASDPISTVLIIRRFECMAACYEILYVPTDDKCRMQIYCVDAIDLFPQIFDFNEIEHQFLLS